MSLMLLMINPKTERVDDQYTAAPGKWGGGKLTALPFRRKPDKAGRN